MSVFPTKQYWDFLLAMTEKEIKARYKFAVLGFLWVVLNPLLQMLVIGFVFQFFIPVKVDNYFLFLFTGLLPWTFFAMTITKNTPMVVHERALISKAKFPREAIILSIVLSNLFHLLISLALLCLALIADKIFFEHYTLFHLLQYALRLLGVLPLLVWLTALTSGLSLLFAALNVRFRDVNFVVQAVMPLWFYATPIVYTLRLLPSFLHPIFYLNPMVGVIEMFQYTILNLQVTSFSYVMLSLAMSVVICIIGWKVFVKESRFFDDWV